MERGFIAKVSLPNLAPGTGNRRVNLAGGRVGFAISSNEGRARGTSDVLHPVPSRRHVEDSGARPSSAADDASGIGISEFLRSKNFLITGGTGFLAKVLIEKILRTNTDVGRIYVVIKAKDTEEALKRLKNEVIGIALFKSLQDIHGKDYDCFVARKLVPVIGDIREANLGIAPKLADMIRDEVDIIVNSAGNTTFDERYDVAMDTNTMGPLQIMSFAHRCRRLKLFLHVSTAYANGQRQGVVLEKPFCLGDTIANEVGFADSSSEHKNGALLDVEAEIKLAFDSRRQSHDSASFTQEMKVLGRKRAKLHGWQDTYVFTKAMGEMVIDSMRGEIPVVTVRPSVIESTWSEPFPGWIQGNRMLEPVIIYYGKGQMRSFLGDPGCVVDVVPADMVVNLMLASMAKHGGARVTAPGIHVYQVASSTANPLVFSDLFGFIHQHFARSPLMDAVGQPLPAMQPMRFCRRMEQYTERLSRRDDLHPRAAGKIAHLGRIYEPYTFYGGRFDTANTEALFAEMSAEEKARFHFDVRSVDWEDYFTNVHIPGVRRHVMKARGSPYH